MRNRGVYISYGTLTYISYGKVYKKSFPYYIMPKGKIKMTKEDKAWALSVKERDGFKCVICNSTERLNAHHILPRELHDTKLDISNGITLCCKHHMFSREISAHNNPLAFILWLSRHRPEQLNYLSKKSDENYTR